MKDNNKKALKFADLLQYTSNETFTLLENLLEWANSQRGLIVFNPTKLSLKNIFEEEISLVKSTALLKGIAIKYLASSNGFVFADEHMLKVITRNLITNAIKYSNPGGEVILSVSVSSNELTVSIADNGVGMSEEVMIKLFKLDSHTSNQGTAGEKGTGLGLILCKDFVEKHGGKIWVESQLGMGAKFTFTIPNHLAN